MSNNSSIFIDSFNYYFNMATGSVISIVGLIGNLLVLFILTRKQFRNVSMFRYYSVVTAVETLQIPIIWIYNFPDFFYFNENEFVCKFIQSGSTLLLVFVTWMPPIISIDRFVSVKYPNKFLFRNKFKFQLSILACLLLGSLAASIPYYYFDKITTIANVTQCSYNEDPWIGFEINISLLVLSLFLPFTISITFGCLTAYQLINKKKRLNIKNFNKEKRLLKVLISMDVFYLICNLPWGVFTILNCIFSMEEYYPSSMIIFYDISNFMFYIYQSFSFFVYFLSNKQFRNYLLKKKCICNFI